MNKDILNKIKEANKNDKRVSMTVSDKIVKLQEEVGEIAAAHLKQIAFKPLKEGETYKDVRANKKEEYADALLVLFDLILVDGFTFEEIEEEMDKGVKKWYSKVQDIKPNKVATTGMFKMNEQTFLNITKENSSIRKPLLLFFYSDTCPPCQTTKEVMDEFSVKFLFESLVAMVHSKDPNCRSLYHQFGIEKTPVIVVVKEGVEVFRHVGVINTVAQAKELFTKYF